MRTLVSRIAFHTNGGQTRLDLVDVGCAHRNWVMVGAMPVERSAQLVLLTWTGVD
jgi:hypothetical protein